MNYAIIIHAYVQLRNIISPGAYKMPFLQDIDMDLGLPATVGTLRGSIKLNRYANIMPCNIISFFQSEL